MDIAFAMELLFQVVPPDDSQVVRVPAMGLDHEPKSAIGPIDVEDRVINIVEVCCCGPEQDHADGRMNGLEMSLCDEAHRRAPGLDVESGRLDTLRCEYEPCTLFNSHTNGTTG